MKRIIDIPDFRFNQCKENIKTIELFEVLVDAVNNGTPISDNATIVKYKYCPNCGAKMEEAADDKE